MMKCRHKSVSPACMQIECQQWLTHLFSNHGTTAATATKAARAGPEAKTGAGSSTNKAHLFSTITTKTTTTKIATATTTKGNQQPAAKATPSTHATAHIQHENVVNSTKSKVKCFD